MENRNVSDLLQQYARQTENANSLANGEVEAKDTCGNCCDCCGNTCLCTAVCVDCFT